ncbi:MAG TPA: hypothetical protein VM008_11015 [Phycisphaerae bacterium]|nr:hypothetical protein [Phycisphaerae bacterium]
MAASRSTMVVHGQPSWEVSSDKTHAFMTEVGGQIGPVTFEVDGRKIAPLSVAPWNEEPEDNSLPAIIRVLRGDFFCMPFGANGTRYRGEKYELHGETANERWALETYSRYEGMTTLHCSLELGGVGRKGTGRKGRADKFVMLRDGETVVYQKHVVSGMKGPMDFGHHAMVKFGSEGLVSTSRAKLRQVWVEPTERPEGKGYSALVPGAVFKDLKRVPTVFGGYADLTRYPARRGFEDIVINVNDPRDVMGWTAVVFPKEGFVFYTLKDPQVLASTLFWLSNGGRYYAPWSGRHVDVMGLEDITGYFHSGLAESAGRNSLSRRGVRTCVAMDPKRPLVVNYIFGVAAVPAGFDHVKEIVVGHGEVELQSRSGKRVRTVCDGSFLTSGA